MLKMKCWDFTNSCWEGIFDSRIGPILEKVIQRKLFQSQVHELVKPITDAEVRKAMFSINSDKAHGPDGYNAKFFQKNGDSW